MHHIALIVTLLTGYVGGDAQSIERWTVHVDGDCAEQLQAWRDTPIDDAYVISAECEEVEATAEANP